MSYTSKNYTAHGGNETVIGGKLTFLPGAEVEGGEGLFGGVSAVMPNQPNSDATTVATLREDLNSLLAKLKDAGMMDADTPAE